MDKILALDEQETQEGSHVFAFQVWGYNLISVYLILSFTMCKFSFLIKNLCSIFSSKKNFNLNFLHFWVACGNNCRTIGNIFHYLACETVNWNGSVYCFFMSYSILLFKKMIEANKGVPWMWETRQVRCKVNRAE